MLKLTRSSPWSAWLSAHDHDVVIWCSQEAIQSIINSPPDLVWRAIGILDPLQ